MQRRIPIKNHQQEIHLITQRSITILVLMFLLIFSLIARLAYLQFSEHELYTTLSKKNWLDLIPLEPTRGLIYDRKGVLLAENVPIFSLDVIPYKIANFPKTLADIAKIIPLSDNDIAQFQKQLKQHRRFDEIPLKFRLSEEEVAAFYENQYRFPGVLVRARLMRHYPLGASFSHVLGYVGRINTQELDDIDPTNYSATNYIGKLGIEKYYEDELHGSVGYEQAETNAGGEPVRVLNQIKPAPGKNLYLTIDSGLQIAAEKALEGNRGAIVAIQPSTGQVLALVSMPSYDPNLFVEGISNTEFQALQQAPDRPLYNRALRGLYPFASTIKPFFALQGLESGATTAKFSFYDPGWFQLKNTDRLFHDHKRGGHGIVNLTRAIECSCDTYFFDLASKMGIANMDDILTQFGFGALSGIDIGEELPGVVASPAWKRRVKGAPWYLGDTINAGIGQGFMQATPLQLASAVSTIANRGARFTPYLVLSQEEPGKTPEQEPPTPLDTIQISQPEYWQIVINAMQNVIGSPQGTAYTRFGIASYTAAGKTGTAQIYAIKRNQYDEAENQNYLPEKLRDHSLLIVFAPVEKPEIALAVIVENSHLAVAIARKVLDYYLAPATPAQNPVIQPPQQPTNTSNLIPEVQPKTKPLLEREPDAERDDYGIY